MLFCRDAEEFFCYIDDINVWESTVSEHDTNSEKVLQCLSKAGLKVNDKCVFGINQFTFLGHVVSKEGLTPIHSKVEAIESNVPKDLTALHSFLGLAGYYSHFMPHSTSNESEVYRHAGHSLLHWC